MISDKIVYKETRFWQLDQTRGGVMRRGQRKHGSDLLIFRESVGAGKLKRNMDHIKKYIKGNICILWSILATGSARREATGGDQNKHIQCLLDRMSDVFDNGEFKLD